MKKTRRGKLFFFVSLKPHQDADGLTEELQFELDGGLFACLLHFKSGKLFLKAEIHKNRSERKFLMNCFKKIK